MSGMNISFLASVEPSRVELGGSTIPLFFSMRAAALMEEKTGLPYPELVRRLFQVPDEEGKAAEALPLSQQAIVVACLIHEGQRAGNEQPTKIEDLVSDIQGMHMESVNQLIVASTQEILFKSARSKKGKNA